MRIGIVCYPTIGGSGILATHLGRELCLRGHEVHFFSYDLPVRLLDFPCNFRFHHVDVPMYPVMRFPPYALALASKLYEVSRDEELDLLHVHYAIPHSTSALLARQMLLKRNQKRVALVTTLHGTDTYLVGLEPSYRTIVEHSLEECDAVTAVSGHLKEDTLRHFDISREIDVIYNFVPFSPPKHEVLRSSGNESTIVHVSNFRSLKRVGDCLQVFELVSRACSHCRLVMVGDGPEMPAAVRFANELGMGDRVTFAGRDASPETWIGAADLLLSTSEIESFGLAIAEAMARGLPIVATRVGGVPEVVEDGKTGFLCEVGDVSGMACAIMRLFNNADLSETMGLAGRDRVERLFSPQVIVPQYEALYARVLAQ